MAKVYSWAINNRTYAYIVNPSNTNEAYIGTELKGNRLQTVADWAQNATDTQYDAQFAKMVALCESNGYDVTFESALSYRTVSTTCDNLRGPAGRGIESVQYSHSADGQSVYVITYDDGATDSFSVRDGRDGRDGVDGAPGAKGEPGVSSKFIMIYTSGKRSDGTLFTPDRPQGGSFDFLTGNAVYPDGWAPSDSEIAPPVYMSSRTFTTSELSTDREWSYPTQITGENGAPGVDGVSTEFIYMLSDVRPSNVSELPSENINGYVPEDYGWSGSPNGVTENNTTEWCCIRKMVENVGWGPWEGPTIWAKYGVNGQDGDGVQYIYMRNKGTPPPNPTPFSWGDSTSDYQLKNNEWVPQKGSYVNYTGESITLTDEFFWSDNPQDVDTDYQFQWVAVRKYRKGDDETVKWQPFSDPTLWGKFGQNGNNGTSVRTLYAISESTSNYPQVPEGVTATGDWQSGFPSDYEFGENVVWGITAEIWAHNNEFVENYKVVSTKDSTGNVIAPPDATGNSVEVNSIPNEKREDFKYLIFNGDYYEWVGGWSQPFLVTGVKGKDGDAINYNSRYFAYGYVDSTPYVFTSTDPKNPGNSRDGKGREIRWYDYPDTTYVGTDNDERRWYQCDVHINGDTQEITEKGPVLPCNGRDGNTLPGNYTEFRFAVTPTEEKPILVQINDEGRIIRAPELWSDDKKEQWGWFKTDANLPEKKPGGAVWEIWATINGTTEEVVTQSDGTGWSGPMRVSGERGEQGIPGPVGKRGITGIPGAMINPMYCLGTEGRNGNGESFDKSGDGYFGSNLWENDVLPEDLEGWYSKPPYSAFLDAINNTQVQNYAGDSANKGRVIRFIATTVNSGVTETFYTYYLITDSGIKTISENVPQKDELHIYIWCTQGKDIWESGTIGDDDDGDKVIHTRTGVDWCDPFRLQGTDGLRGMAGNRGQVIYPMGIYNEEEVYITTETKAPYVYDPNDGLFYVYNVVDKPWVGRLPDNYKSVKIDKNGNEADGAEYYKYSVDGTYDNWIPEQKTTPSLNYANHIAAGSTPAWERFESFKALYTQIGIIENGMIGSAVYNNEFMFSQQGLESDGITYSTDYEKFLSGYAYDDKGKVENGETKHWYYKGTDDYISDRDVNPYEPTSETNSTCIHDFQPNVCINFKTGEMWLSGGKVNFDSNGGGYLANHYINWTEDGTVIIGKPGEDSVNGIVMSSTGMTIGPLDAYKLEMDGTISGINNTIRGVNKDIRDLTDLLNSSLDDIQGQVDKKAETYYQPDNPSSGWGDAKSEHVGDMWYDTSTHITYRWNGTEWEEQEIPSHVFDVIDGKSSVYVSRPTEDNDGDGYLYKTNDMWFLEQDYTGSTQLGITGKKGSIWVSKNDRSGTFEWNDWVKKGTELDEWVQNEFPGLVGDMVEQPDGVVNTHYGDADPSSSGNWQKTDSAVTSTYAPNHLGDLWFNTTNNKSYIYADTTANTTTHITATPSGYYWVVPDTDVPQEIYDALDGKNKIFVSEPRTPWNEGDLWLKDATSGTSATDIYRARQDRESGVTNSDEFNITGKNDWIKACNYTNDDVALQALGRLNAMADDGYVSPEEQKRLVRETIQIKDEADKLIIKAREYDMHDSGSPYYSTYQSFIIGYDYALSALTYYTTSSNAISNSADTYYLFIKIDEGYSGTGTTGQYYGNIAAYYGFKQDLQNALVSAAENSAYTKAYDFVTGDAYIGELTSKLVITDNIVQSEEKWGLLSGGTSYFASTSGQSNARILFNSDGSGQIGVPSKPGIEWDSSGTLFINRSAGEGIRLISGEIINTDGLEVTLTPRQTTLYVANIGDTSVEMPNINISLSGDFSTDESYQGTLKFINETKYPLLITFNTSDMTSGTTLNSGKWYMRFKGIKDSSSSDFKTEFILPPFVNNTIDLYNIATNTSNSYYYNYRGIIYNQFNNYFYSPENKKDDSGTIQYSSLINGTKLLMYNLWKYKIERSTNLGTNSYVLISGHTNSDKIEIHTNGAFSATTIGNIWVKDDGSKILLNSTVTTTNSSTYGIYGLMLDDTEDTSISCGGTVANKFSHWKTLDDSNPIAFNVRKTANYPMTSFCYTFVAYVATSYADGTTILNDRDKASYISFYNDCSECGRAYFYM